MQINNQPQESDLQTRVSNVESSLKMYEHVLNRQVDQLKQTIHAQNEKIEAMKIENQLVLQARISEER